MRLIDLDQIEYFTLVDSMGVPRYKIEIGEDIGIEEVKAIPIGWIRDYMRRLPDGSVAYECILVMLEDWEENGTI